MSHVDTVTRTFIAAVDLVKAQLVTLHATLQNQVIVNTNLTAPIGSCQQAAKAGDTVSVKLLGANGTIEAIADGAIGTNVIAYAAAGGEVAAAGTVTIGFSLEAAGGGGEIIEVLANQGAA